jgi:hypothetical protein
MLGHRMRPGAGRPLPFVLRLSKYEPHTVLTLYKAHVPGSSEHGTLRPEGSPCEYPGRTVNDELVEPILGG